MKPEIYEPAGWVNVPWIASRGNWLNVLIGARQVGKTYGTLKYHLLNHVPHILLRRTTDELKFIGGNSELDPYKALEREGLYYKLSAAGGFYTIMEHDGEGQTLPGTQIGLALSLPQIAHIRGFNGSAFESMVLDEAVPEKGVRVLRTEGEQLLNAYTTIAGNRELEGRPPLKLWLLSNSNNINSPILEALNLMDDIISMQNRGLEWVEHDGICIFNAKSAKITEQRKNAVLARQIRKDSPFAQMAYNNEWAYDKSPLIRQRSIKGLTPLCSYDERMYLWEGPDSIYVCTAHHKADRYDNSDFSTAQFRSNFAWLKPWYAEGMIFFSNVKLLAMFKRIFNIDF